jgi:hypothetical protein
MSVPSLLEIKTVDKWELDPSKSAGLSEEEKAERLEQIKVEVMNTIDPLCLGYHII